MPAPGCIFYATCVPRFRLPLSATTVPGSPREKDSAFPHHTDGHTLRCLCSFLCMFVSVRCLLCSFLLFLSLFYFTAHPTAFCVLNFCTVSSATPAGLCAFSFSSTLHTTLPPPFSPTTICALHLPVFYAPVYTHTPAA